MESRRLVRRGTGRRGWRRRSWRLWGIKAESEEHDAELCRSVSIVSGDLRLQCRYGFALVTLRLLVSTSFYPTLRLGTHVAHSFQCECRGLEQLAAGILHSDSKFFVCSTALRIKWCRSDACLGLDSIER